MNIQPAIASSYFPSQQAADTGSGGGITPRVSTGPTEQNQQTKTRDSKATRGDSDAPQSSRGTIEADEAELTQEELRLVEKLKQVDGEVRRHEMAHMAAGGAYITSGATFSYQKGPDGKNYAVGGEVGIDTSPVPGDPQATLRKMRQVRSAALAPASPSSQDLKVAANAASQSSQALSEITMLRAEKQAEQRETQAFSNTPKNASDAYTRVNTLPEEETSTFELAV